MADVVCGGDGMLDRGVLKVAAFGSCRVFRPLNKAKKQEGFETTHSGIEWYTHSPQEAIQKADIVECKRDVPDDILHLLVDTEAKYNVAAHSPDKFSDTDVIVLEVSTLKRHEYAGWELQQWRVVNLAKGKEDNAPAESIRISREVEVTELSANEFLDFLEAFRARMGKPLVVVPHLACPSFHENVLKPRLKIRRLAEKFAELHDDVAVYDPTALVIAHGEDVALVDSGHYQPAFEKVVGVELGRACKLLMSHLT